MRTDQDARQQIVQVVRELFDMGQLTPTGGNVSARGASDAHIWITPSQMYSGCTATSIALSAPPPPGPRP